MSNAFRTLALFALATLPLAAQSATATTNPTATPEAVGLVLNGRSFNGVNFNGLQFNGMRMNGWSLNGLQFNGFRMNGKLFNGLPFDGTLSRRGFVGAFEARAGANADASWSSLELADVRVRLPLAR